MCDSTFARGRQEAEQDLYREEERHENAADYPVDELHILVPKEVMMNPEDKLVDSGSAPQRCSPLLTVLHGVAGLTELRADQHEKVREVSMFYGCISAKATTCANTYGELAVPLKKKRE